MSRWGKVISASELVWQLSSVVGTYTSHRGTICAVIWISLNVLLNFLNKILFIKESFKFPVFIILFGTLSTFVGCVIMVYGFKFAKVDLTRALQHWKILAVLSCVHGATSAFQNMSMVYISISLGQVIKVTTPGWTLLLERIFLGKVEERGIIAATFITIAGAAIALAESPEISGAGGTMLGVFLSIASTICGAIQVVIIALLLQSVNLSSTELILATSLPMSLFLFPIFLVLEADQLFEELRDQDVTIIAELTVLLTGVLAFIYTINTYLLIQYTSSLVTTLVGNVKVVVLVVLAMMVFGTSWNWINVAGIVCSIAGFCLFNYLKYKAKNQENGKQKHTMYIKMNKITVRSSEEEEP